MNQWDQKQMTEADKEGLYTYATGTVPQPDLSPRTLQISPGKRILMASVVATPGGAGATLQIGDRQAIPIAAGTAFTISGNDVPDAWHGPINVIIAGDTLQWFVSWGTPTWDPYADERCRNP